jgi:hypothetical protein
MIVTKDKRALVKNDLIHVRFDSTGTHMVSTPPIIQSWGLHIPWRGGIPHCNDMTRQRQAGGPIPSSIGCRPLDGAGAG